MQEASDDAAYTAAVDQPAKTWAKPLVYADWAQDGYGAAGTIDDLSDRAGRPIEINQFLDDGLPAEVSFVAGVGTSEVEIPMGSGDTSAFSSALRYFSPFRTDSAIYSYPRDVAPLKVETQLVTPSGLAAVRVFTGQMIDTPIKNGRPSVLGMSATRLALASLVQPPARAESERGLHFGLTAAWPVVWALNECGIYAAPPSVSGCRLWVPLHGSGQPFIPGDNQMSTNLTGFMWSHTRNINDTISQTDELPTWIDGPYVGAFEATNTAEDYSRLFGVILGNDQIGAGEDWLSQTASRGRVQFYVRGEAVEIDDVPGGITDWTIGDVPSAAMLMGLALCNGNDTGIVVGVNLNRHVFMELRQSSTRRIYHSTAPIVLTDDFNRNTVSGFGTATTGQSYTSSGGVAGDRSTTTAASGHGDIDTNTTATPYVMAADISSPDQEVSTVMRISALPASGTLSIGLVARYTDASNYYRAEMQIATTGAITARIVQRVAGVETVLQTGLTGGTYVAATDYYLRFQVIGSTMRMKVGANSGAESSGWGFEVYDNTALATGNLGGVYCRNDSAATTHIFSWDSLEIRNLALGQIPIDGEFHFVGTAWDVANNKLWVRLDDALTAFTPSPAMSTAGLPVTHDFFESDTISGIVGISGSDLQFSTGADASPDTNPLWIHDAASWTRGAIVTRSILNLEVVAVEQPQEAWALIGSYAQSEMAALRTDELDVVQYLTLPHWVSDDAQTVAQVWSTATNCGSPEFRYDVSKIRNSVRVEYSQVRVDDIISPVVVLNTAIAIFPGTTVVLFATSKPSTRLYGGRFYVLSQAQVNGTDPSPPNPTYVVFNTQPDGTGTYADPGPSLIGVDVFAEVISWTSGQALVEFTNNTTSTYYTVHGGTADLDYLNISAYAVQSASASATAEDDVSVAVRGRRSLPVQLSEVQSDPMAAQMAQILVGDLASPIAEITSLEVLADARRQPGDLISFTDSESGLSGHWRTRGIRHVIDGAEYRQYTTLRRARDLGAWDAGTWDNILWGE